METLKKLLRRLALVDWTGVILSLIKTLKKEDTLIDPEYLAIKPKVLSDHNLLRGLAALRTVLSFIPATQVAASVISLGDTGFKIWKAIALRQDYDQLTIPPLGLNVIRFNILFDPTLKLHFAHLVEQEDWSGADQLCNDLSFITDPKILKEKYPMLPEDFVGIKAAQNKKKFGETVLKIEQEFRKVKHLPEIDTNVEEAVFALKEIFPALRDWSLLNSKAFDDVVKIIDIIV